MKAYSKTIFILFFLLLPSVGWAQKVIKGTITSAGTGESLPAANIVIQGVYQGTVSNSQGQYYLNIPDSLLPVTIEVSYIGYYSKERVVKRHSSRQQNFRLKPSVAQLEELTVTAQREELTIMERVIRRKHRWKKKLHTYIANAYSRQVLSNDTSIVSITESVSTLYWGETKGFREVQEWRNQTANVEVDQNFSGVSYLPNLYNDNIEIAGFKLVGITNPEALKYYDFEVVDLLSQDGKKVYKIKVIPDKELQPLFSGYAYVLDGAFALLKVNLVPNDVVRFPFVIQDFNLNYRQQFNNYGGSVWLPVNIRITGEVKIDMVGLEFPMIHFKQVGRVTNYKLNVSLPDSLYKEDEQITIDSTQTNDSLFVSRVKRIPLSPKAQKAYATIDSSDTFEEAFKPTGFLTKFVDGDEDENEADTTSAHHNHFDIDIPGSFSPRLRYNRVEALYVGLKYNINVIAGIDLMLEGGFSTARNNWSYGAGLQYTFWDLPFKPTVGALYRLHTKPRYRSLIYNPTMTSILNLLGYENYFDYFRDEGVKFYIELEDDQDDLSLRAAFMSKKQTSLSTATSYDILGRDHIMRPNPAINEGRLNTLKFALTYKGDESYKYGITGVNQFSVSVEMSREAWDSDFNYTHFTGNISWSFETFFQRRLLPNKLYVWLSGGTFTGRLPYQRFGIVDVTEGFFSPFGVLRTVRFRPYEGAQYVVLHAEHDFRTVPFELLGLDWLVDQNIGMIAFGSIAKTHIDDARKTQIINRTGYVPFTTDGIHAEAGLSITGILKAFRVDFSYRIDEPGFFVTIGLTRVF